MSDSESFEGGVPLQGRSSRSSTPESTLAKRKRDDDIQKSKKKSAKRRKMKKPKDISEEDFDEELGINTAISCMDSALLADYVAQRTKRYEPDLSLVELEDRRLPERAILDTSSWEKSRTLEHLPAYLEHFADGNLSKSSKSKGQPHTLVIAGAGLRAADLTRALRKFQHKESAVAKLFAKHIKLKEAVETCQKLRMNIGVGTPQRVYDLLEDGALSSESLRRIVIDASHIDQKKRGILDMKEIQLPLMKLLTRQELKDRYGTSDRPIQVLFY